MALLPLKPEPQRARGAELLAQAKRDPEIADFLSFLPTRVSGVEKWRAIREDANRRFRAWAGEPEAGKSQHKTGE